MRTILALAVLLLAGCASKPATTIDPRPVLDGQLTADKPITPGLRGYWFDWPDGSPGGFITWTVRGETE